MSNIHGLNSFREKDEKDDDDDRNERYVGGVDSRGGGSGLAVEPNMDDGGAAADPSSSRDSVFNLAETVGGGGGGPNSSHDGTPQQQEATPRRTITMYRDGFIVDQGPYRRLDDPANADFLRSLARGMTPRELMEESTSGDVTVGLIDKRSEDYVETFQSFSGAGTTLGGSTSAGHDDDANADAGGTNNGIVDPSTLPTPTPVDTSRPTTSIQVRLLNGTKKVIKLNADMTVLQLAAHIGGDSNFTLVSGFPPKPILNLQQTLEEAGLKGAQVVQKKA